ncbi:13842_t:CDS:1 [Funneliformis geosporum]|nr:13842_t:CDS:1 [Funneliformis geosporum]
MNKKNNKLSCSSIENLSFEEYSNNNSQANTSKKKVILTVSINEECYQKLKWLVPEGGVSKFTEKIIKEAIKKIEEKVFQEYSEANQEKEVVDQIEKLSI